MTFTRLCDVTNAGMVGVTMAGGMTFTRLCDVRNAGMVRVTMAG